jgi:hypothetical protein
LNSPQVEAAKPPDSLDDNDLEGLSFWRLALGVAGCLLAAIAGLAAWYWLKVISIVPLWSEASIFFMPLPIGVLIGWIAGRTSQRGSRGLANFAVVLAGLATVGGMTLQHAVTVNVWLDRITKAAYEETCAYAGRVAQAKDEADFGRIVSNEEQTVLSGLADETSSGSALSHWQRRNLLHVHWIACRQLVTKDIPSSLDGLSRSIWVPTHLVQKKGSFRALVENSAKEPLSDERMLRFKKDDLPELQALLSRKTREDQFEGETKALVKKRTPWTALVLDSFAPLTLCFGFLGMILCHKLAYQASVEDEI